jgi:hypothetical protein
MGIFVVTFKRAKICNIKTALSANELNKRLGTQYKMKLQGRCSVV